MDTCWSGKWVHGDSLYYFLYFCMFDIYVRKHWKQNKNKRQWLAQALWISFPVTWRCHKMSPIYLSWHFMFSFIQMLLQLNYSKFVGDLEDDFRPFIKSTKVYSSEGKSLVLTFCSFSKSLFLWECNLDVKDVEESIGKSDREAESVGLFMLKVFEIFFQSSQSL